MGCLPRVGVREVKEPLLATRKWQRWGDKVGLSCGVSRSKEMAEVKGGKAMS